MTPIQRLFRSSSTRVGNLAPALGAAAAALGAASAFNLVSTARAERKHPPGGEFIEVDGVKLHYLEKGEGPPIVLIHGVGVLAEDWVVSGVFDRLAQGHRVIAFDRPGYGYSQRPRTTIWSAKAQAELFASALRRLGIERAVVVGHSWGTLVAMNMALDHPGMVSALGLLSGYYQPTPRVDVAMATGPAIPVIGDLVRFTVSPLLGWLITPLVFKHMFSPSKVTRNFKERFPTSMMLRPSQIRASSADAGLMIPSAAKAMGRHGELAMPVLIMAGDGDKLLSCSAQSETLAREISQSTLRVLPGVGHMIHHTAPEAVILEIRALAAGQG